MSYDIETWSGCTSAMAECLSCEWNYENQYNALALAKKHALKYGHAVSIQVVTAVKYRPRKVGEKEKCRNIGG